MVSIGEDFLSQRGELIESPGLVVTIANTDTDKVLRKDETLDESKSDRNK